MLPINELLKPPCTLHGDVQIKIIYYIIVRVMADQSRALGYMCRAHSNNVLYIVDQSFFIHSKWLHMAVLPKIKTPYATIATQQT